MKKTAKIQSRSAVADDWKKGREEVISELLGGIEEDVDSYPLDRQRDVLEKYNTPPMLRIPEFKRAYDKLKRKICSKLRRREEREIRTYRNLDKGVNRPCAVINGASIDKFIENSYGYAE